MLTRLRSTLVLMPLLFYGVFFLLFGFSLYIFGVLLSVPRIIFGLDAYLLQLNEAIVWYSGIPVLIGLILCLMDMFVLLPCKTAGRTAVMELPVEETALTVALTAYNDEESIAMAVRDFQAHPLVTRVLVVSNNSTDSTLREAGNAGAIVFNEAEQGYGHCVYRCLSEAVKYEDTSLTLLCEGDRTFRAYDIDKFMAYIRHADIVNGTRIVEQLRERKTQLSTFVYYGNFFAGKLLEFKHIGKGSFTDVGTTYKLCRNDSLKRLLPYLDRTINLEFNAHFLDTALTRNEILVECPVTFHARVGLSKGGNVNNRRAFAVGVRMIGGLLFGWKGQHV